MQNTAMSDDLSGMLDILQALDDEVVVLDAGGQIIASNAAWENFCIDNGGDLNHCSIGSNYMAVCAQAEGPSSTAARIVPQGLQDTLATGKSFRCEYPCDSPTEKRWFELSANRFEKGERRYLVVQHRNITRRHVESKAVEDAYINANAMTALVASTSDAVISYDLDGNIITWNPSAERLYGYRSEEILGKSLETLFPEDWPKRITYYRDEIIAGRLPDFEATRIAKNGAEREVWISCAPIRNPEGEVIAISNIHRDVTEVRNAERARDLIANEVIHRAKNMLSVVLAIQGQTARNAPSLEAFNRSFGQRLASLAKSTDLLVHNAWTSVSLEAVVAGHLEPFTTLEAESRVTISGPRVNLQPEAVQTIGMAIHELATNAAKYGVLSQERGQIAITWQVVPEAGQLHFDWRETGMEIAAEPANTGFGHTVLTAHASAVLEAEAAYQMGDEGILWAIQIPPAHFTLH